MSDEDEDVRSFCLETLEDFSVKMEHTLKQLEDRDVEEKKEDSNDQS